MTKVTTDLWQTKYMSVSYDLLPLWKKKHCTKKIHLQNVHISGSKLSYLRGISKKIRTGKNILR